MATEDPWWIRYIVLAWAWFMNAPWVLIVVGLALVVLGAYRLGTLTSPAAVDAPEKPPTVTPPARPKVTTGPYDIPIKLGLLDELYNMIPDVQKMLTSAARVRYKWAESIAADRNGYFLELQNQRMQCRDIEKRFIDFGNKVQRFDDIRNIANFICNPLDTALAEFANALRALGDPPTGKPEVLISPWYNKVEDALREMGNWPGNTNEKILALRKELSQ